jgi:peptide/nickel transport system permease protein
MGTYIIRRLIIAIFIILIVSLIVFFTMQLLPGDPLIIFLGRQAGTGTLSPEQVKMLYHQYGLDQPLMVQYWNWLTGVFRGNLGTSITYHQDVARLLMQRFPVTLNLGLESFVISNFLGIMLGMVAALRRGKWLDSASTVLSYIGVSVPVFWLGILMIYAFGLKLGWFPIYGYTSPTVNLWDNIYHSVMPVACLSLMGWAVIARQMRSSMLEVISQDYVRTAWAKGLTEKAVVLKHMLKNSLIPVITLMGIGLGLMLGGQVFVETVFAIPGVGRLLVNAVFAQDYPIVQSTVLVLAGVVILVNLLVDISYGWFDPRIRYG